MDLAPRHRHRGAAVAHRREEGLAVPRVERAVVAALAAGGEDEIVRDLVAAAEAVVGVDPSARPVEEDVAAHRRLRRLGLHEEGRLLLVEANLAGAAAGDGGVARVVAVCPVHPRVRVVFDPLAGPARVGRRLVGVPPRGDRIPSDEGEVGVGDGGVAVVPRHHHRVPVDPLERARVESDPLGALQEDGAHAVQRPIAGGRDAVRVHVRVARGAEGDAAVRDAARRRPTRRADVDERAERRRDDRRGGGRWPGAIVKEVEPLRLRVEKELARRVELLVDVLHEEVAAAVFAARALVAALAKREIAGGGVVRAHLEHPVGPARRPPHEEECAGRVLVRRVRQRARLGRHPRRRAEGEGASAGRVARAPVRDGRVVDGAEPAHSNHVVLEPAAVRAVVRTGVVRVKVDGPELVEVGRRPVGVLLGDHPAVAGRHLDPSRQVRVARPRRAHAVDLQARDVVHPAHVGDPNVGRLVGGVATPHVVRPPRNLELDPARDDRHFAGVRHDPQVGVRSV
mmetsp:Transcript_49340/g.161350  ORF Transcript_49340/g.161350 Transcript_49340/m.161350 type:complete len:512 (+) Transcript_49340:561-2096(+)